jgi:extracellular factor (EF) 3-hydroxypalmitic acid methyl ester biosynthesis protein
VAKKSKAGQESQVVFKNPDGVELRGAILKLGQSRVIFEVYPVRQPLQAAEVFGSFQVWVDGREIFSGRAVVRNFLNLGSRVACEAELQQPEAAPGAEAIGGKVEVGEAYESFFRHWQGQAKVSTEFKAVVSDLQSYLSGLKLLLERVEASITAGLPMNRADLEVQVAKTLAAPVLASLNTLRERLLETAKNIVPERRPAYEAILRRQLHPLFLCAPFAFRAYQKPLGYAGDYEMMNMIHRNTFEGESLYARLVHYWLVNQYPAISVRNRVAHMKGKLLQETVRRGGQGEPVRILNVGCGPAREVGQFIAESPAADRAEFTLIDFDRETLNHATATCQEAKARHGRRTGINAIQMSATQLLKGSAGRAYPAFAKPFDLIYCGGLFDYFSDEICKQMVAMFYDRLRPGGLTVVANMDDRVPYKEMQEYLLDWHLIYRDNRRMEALVPDGVDRADWKLVVESVGVNLFLEVRKPDGN